MWSQTNEIKRQNFENSTFYLEKFYFFHFFGFISKFDIYLVISIFYQIFLTFYLKISTSYGPKKQKTKQPSFSILSMYSTHLILFSSPSSINRDFILKYRILPEVVQFCFVFL